MRIVYVHTKRLDSEKANVVQVLQMCKEFARAGHDVDLRVPPCSGALDEKQMAREILGDQPDFHIVSFRARTFLGRFSNLGQVRSVKASLRELRVHWQPDVVIVRHPVMLGPAVESGIPVVFESHSPYSHNTSRVLDRFRQKLVVELSKKADVKRFVAISNNLADFWIKQGVPRDKVLVLHDGFDVEMFKTEFDRNVARRDLGLPVDRQIVTYAGSLYENRGIETILELANAFPDVLFVIVGGPEERRQCLARKIKNQENINFVGRIPPIEVPLYLGAADVLLMIWGPDVPTIDYCSPLKMFEYMAAGRMIVGHGYPTIREVLEHGVHGLLADPGCYEELHQLLRTALEQESSSPIPGAARRLAFERYTWQRRSDLMIEALQESLNAQAA